MRNAPTYNQRRLARLSRAFALFAIVGTAPMLAGCSTTYHLGALFGGKDEPERSTAAAPTTAVLQPAVVHAPLGADLTVAKAAAEALLARGTKDGSIPWEDPNTGARGTVTALATSSTQDGACRTFLASYVNEGRESWYEGSACDTGNRWQVRDMKPLQRTAT